jgi:2-polyprenyl-6-methoxyphenol hydroxylase-like FAD-dependent oxidoreductase
VTLGFGSEPLPRMTVPEQKRLIAERLAGLGWEVPKLLEAMAAADVFYFDAMAQVHLDRWSAGRVVLVGDAGYCASPASGQGTSLAIVGAYVLAGELATGGGAESYEREMRGFVEANQALGPVNIKGMVVPSSLALWIQIRMLRLLPHLPGRDKMIERITGPIHRASIAIVLKDYVE